VSDILIRIKRAVLAGRYDFSDKANDEMERDGLTPGEVAESILNAASIYKTIRSRGHRRRRHREYLHIIWSTTLTGRPVYSKGKLVAEGGFETYYFLVSAKRCE